jgi:protein-S-isoprenylcysteine O-methyltransferase Ste14
MFGSKWSIIPVSISAVLLIIRTRLEDRTLTNELNGYQAYATKTKSKLIPGIW